jgi:uncharacterized membrane protein
MGTHPRREGVMLALNSYTAIKFLHVLLAMTAVGFNLSYGIWLSRSAKEPEHLSHVLRGIKALDDRFANPAYALLLVTGLVMVRLGHLDLTTFWLAAALVLYAILIVLGIGVYTPTLRKQIAAFEERGAASAEYRSLATRGTVVGVILAVNVVAIVFLMVTKPSV